MEVKDLYSKKEEFINKAVTLSGWVKNHRKQKDFGFIDFYDGSCFKTLQVVYENTIDGFENIKSINVGSSVQITGLLVESSGKNQEFEVKASNINLLGKSDEDYPIQPKRHSNEFLREQAYLRGRTNIFSAVFRVRSITAGLIHEYFQSNGYIYLNAPIITGADAEGAGEMFTVTSQSLENIKKDENGETDYKNDFFGKHTNLTVSGQLQAESFAMCFGKTYTFGPTFRAENSNTKTHAAEFWMIEPEIAFADLYDVMDIQEDTLKYVVRNLLVRAKDEIEFLDKFVKNGLLAELTKFTEDDFARVTHEEAVEILQASGRKFEFEAKQGEDFAKEHERYLAEEHFKKPVFVYNWPKDIKAFYMKLNEDGKTVAAVDLLIPGIGELIGGSQREENYDVLLKKMDDFGINKEELSWYLNLRKYGTCVHSGFGIGFERLLMYVTGMDNIRDVIAFPRTPGNCEY